MNSSHRPPLIEILFVLDKVLDWRRLFRYPAYRHVDPELAEAILTEAAKFVSDIIAPLNQSGDEQGSRLIDGKVLTPDGFKEAFKQFSEAGWTGLDMPEKFGGQALPLAIQLAFADMLNGACISFAMLPLMLRAASSLLIEHGTEDIVERVVPNLVAGKWGATICISEAGAGSDVGRIKTRALPQPDGSYLISGSKIFISYGDHDFTEQIVHMVLARTPDAAAGSRGLSLFLVPKLSFESGQNNNVSVSRLEKKMGLKASPTCVLDLEQAVAYRIGEQSRGLHCMFTMVNLMRLEVSIQGPAIASAAIHKAQEYATQRRQGGRPDMQPPGIIEHADVRRMLFIMRARTEAMRALVYETAFNLDIARVGEDEQQRREAGQLAEFLLPVCKAAGSETGFEVASLAVQIFAGHGYISDTGVEQYVRDARVSMIYEGTNGIQALDLLTRKLLKEEGIRYQLFIDRISKELEKSDNNQHSQIAAKALQSAMGQLEDCTVYLIDRSGESMTDLEAGATDYLKLVGLVAGGWMHLRIINAVDLNSDFGRTKIALANFYAQYLMPEALTLTSRITMGAQILYSLDSDTLVSA